MRLVRLITHFGSVEAAWNASEKELIAAGLDRRTLDSLLHTRVTRNLDKEIERIERAGADILTTEDAEYPALLRQIELPPPLLYIRGSLRSSDEWAVGVVGTRSPTVYGKEAAHRITHDLATQGVTIISGMALGIDTIAHTTTLDAGGRTIAVLGCGVDIAYPERNRGLAQRILEQGAIISEYALGTAPSQGNFPPRNRIITGMSLGTLIVEAGAQSGALISGNFALDQGREVFVVPGSIFSRASEGTHSLIRNGATLVTSANDILEALNMTQTPAHQEIASLLPRGEAETAILAVLSAEPQHVDEIGRACGMAASAVGSTLTMLELKGAVRQVSPQYFVLAR